MKRLFVAGIVTVMAVFLVGPASADSGQWKERWKFGTIAPDGVGWARHIKGIVVPAVEASTDGNLEVKVYWGGIMGDDEDYVKKMRIGQLQGAGWSGQGVTLAVPEMAVVELPFLFNSYEEVDFIKSKMKDTFDEIAKKNGYMMIAWIDEDFCRIYSAALDMTSAKHFEQAKILSWFGPIEEEVLQSLSASPLSVNMPEAPPSLRQGLGDSIIASSLWILGTQLYSTLKYASSYDLRYAPAMIAVSWEAWETMPQEYKTRYFKMRDDVTERFCTEVRKDNAKSHKAMLQYGIIENPIAPSELEIIRENSRKVWDEAAGKLYPEELLEELLDSLAEFREN